MKYIHCLLSILLISSLRLTVCANNNSTVIRTQDSEHSKSDSTAVAIHFEIGKSVIIPSLYNNAYEFENVLNQIKFFNDEGRDFSVDIIGLASPDGRAIRNKELARQRSENSRKFIESKIGDNIDIKFTVRNGGINWNGLKSVLKTAKYFNGRDEALTILEEISADGTLPDIAVNKLRNLHNGQVWSKLYADYFPELRTALITVYSPPRVAKPSKMITVYEEQTESEDIETNTERNTSEKIEEVELSNDSIVEESVNEEYASPISKEMVISPFYMSLHTNMLYDVLLLPNIGMEFYLGKNWSIRGNWMYGWWDNNRRHRFWRAYGGDISVRKWLGSASKNKPLTGHHLGIYTQILQYDFEFGGKGQIGGGPGVNIWHKANYGAGIEYGFALPISRRLNIDFSIGVGYLGGEYYEYKPEDDHYVWLGTKKRHWFGPTKAEISLVWLLGHNNINMKGGKR